MNNFSPENWERIKNFAARLQAIRNILDFFESELENKSFAEEFNPIVEQLKADFERNLEALLEIIDNEDNEIN